VREQGVPGPGVPTTPARLLVVDDDVVVREMFAEVLRLEGHTVRTAGGALAALDEVAVWHPHAILVDYRMGLINGLGFLYRLRADQSAIHTPVAVITGQVDVEGAFATECAGLGAAVYFKPLRLVDLRAIARRLLTQNVH
jgi:CheY-like chemotaxis protein